MKTYFAVVTVVFVLLQHANAQWPWSKKEPDTGNIPDAAPAKAVQEIVTAPNEVLIAASFVDADPSLVLGSIVDLNAKQVRMDNFLKAEAKPIRQPKTEVKFRSLLEKKVAAEAGYLGFVSAALSDERRAEVSLVKNAVMGITMADLHVDKLRQAATAAGAGAGSQYGIIIQCTDYLLTASFLRVADKKAEASGYGAKMGGKWYNKEEGLNVERLVVATYIPLDFLPAEQDAKSKQQPIVDLVQPKLKDMQLKKLDKLEFNRQNGP